MSKKKVVSICFAVMFVSVAGIALAMAVKVALMPYNAPPEWRTPNASGHAILVYNNADKTEIQVNCWGLNPNNQYSVWLKAPDQSQPYMIGTLTAQNDGAATLHARLDGDRSNHVPVSVAVATPPHDAPVHFTILKCSQ